MRNRHLARHLDRAARDLRCPWRAVDIAQRQQRPRHVHRATPPWPRRAGFGQSRFRRVLPVPVARPPLVGRRHADRADERVEGHAAARVLQGKRSSPSSTGTKIVARREVAAQRVAAASAPTPPRHVGHVGRRPIRAGHHVQHGDRQPVARLRALHEDRPRDRFVPWSTRLVGPGTPATPGLAPSHPPAPSRS